LSRPVSLRAFFGTYYHAGLPLRASHRPYTTMRAGAPPPPTMTAPLTLPTSPRPRSLPPMCQSC